MSAAQIPLAQRHHNRQRFADRYLLDETLPRCKAWLALSDGTAAYAGGAGVDS